MTVSTLKITQPRIETVGNNQVELSAQIGTEKLWFRLPADQAPLLRGDAFVVAALLPAMKLGVPLEIDESLGVDSQLLQNLEQLQGIFRLWGPLLGHHYRRVPIIARADQAPSGNGKVMSFFSGGVDGTYTLVNAPEKVEQAVFIRGIDFQLDNPVYDQALARNAAWLEERNVALMSMSSNLRWVLKAYGLGWGHGVGAGLSSFAHVVQAKKMFLAAGHSWRELRAETPVSHPIIDPLFSSSAVQIIHHGREANRGQKIARIAKEPMALDILRVCWQDKADYNCGQCEKCIRTMVLLRLLGLKSPNFPELSDLSKVRNCRPGDNNEAVYLQEAIILANEVGDNELAEALGKAWRRWERHALLRDIYRAWFKSSDSFLKTLR